MARGRRQKWTCKDCKAEFCVQNQSPKFCCLCGPVNIGRAPRYELIAHFEQKRLELNEVYEVLNPVYREYMSLRTRYDEIMAYWKMQRHRGFISTEEYEELADKFDGGMRM